MAQLFSDAQIKRLREGFAKLERIDPCGPTYPKLTQMLDEMSQEQLEQVRNAKIKFLGNLAANRLWRASK